MAQISVIVAVYKMPEYLPRCIEGILGHMHLHLIPGTCVSIQNIQKF